MPAQQYTIDAALLQLAETWPVLDGTTEIRSGHPTDYASPQDWAEAPVQEVPCKRCQDCGQAVIPADAQARLVHLMSAHGYRMDGTAYDNDNQITTTAAEELTARGNRQEGTEQ
jgi:hypothetical protein